MTNQTKQANKQKLRSQGKQNNSDKAIEKKSTPEGRIYFARLPLRHPQPNNE